MTARKTTEGVWEIRGGAVRVKTRSSRPRGAVEHLDYSDPSRYKIERIRGSSLFENWPVL